MSPARRLLAIAALVLLPAVASAQSTITTGGEQVVLGLSHNRVSITADFDGSEILVFGAVKRETPIPESPLEVIITIAGPSAPVVIHRKAHRFGIWINTDSVEIDSAPSFYAVATSGPLAQVLSHTEDLRHSVSIPRAVRSVGADVSDSQNFTAALIRIRRAQSDYQMLENEVVMDQQTLFRTRIALPANLTEGTYATRIFLTREGRVVARLDSEIDVRKVGLERWLFNLSRENALAYGVLSLIIAVAAGWAASEAFRLLRR